MVYKSALLDSGTAAKHGFFGRRGGVCTGILRSLNCGYGTSSAAEDVAENRARVANVMHLEPTRLLSVRQMHGPQVVTVEKAWDQDARPQADAMVTRLPGFGLGILTADCAPVLFVDETARVIGAAHAGWKGALGGVIDATVAAMLALGASRPAISAAVGPCIAQASYEVDAAFQQRFVTDDAANEHFFTPLNAAGHCRFDLPGYVAARLRACGVHRIEINGTDTYTEEEDLFSFRRATHRNEAEYGRQLSVIAL